MKYLFFDIECANPKYNSICTFGYVITDEDFGVIEQKDILMNPETGYDKYVIKNILRYPTEELDAKMPFPCYYDEIEKLMCSPETVVLGFSISNDIRFLNETCIRYRMPSLNYRFFDVQKIYGDYVKVQDQASIETAGEALHLNKPFFVHRSDEDARITMEILKAICTEKNMTLSEFLAKASSCGGRNHNFIETWDIDGKQPIDHKKNHYKKKMLLAEKRRKKEEEKAVQQTSSSERLTASAT
ncbi:MAG: 3'-5' exonuclease [Clostridia bacterium]|nr:3'-5' exonuclease [Clostridia bacterium]